MPQVDKNRQNRT